MSEEEESGENDQMDDDVGDVEGHEGCIAHLHPERSKINRDVRSKISDGHFILNMRGNCALIIAQWKRS